MKLFLWTLFLGMTIDTFAAVKAAPPSPVREVTPAPSSKAKPPRAGQNKKGKKVVVPTNAATESSSAPLDK